VKRLKPALAGFVLGVAVAAAAGVSASTVQPASLNFEEIKVTYMGGKGVKGLVVAGRNEGQSRATVYASFHGLPVIGAGAGAGSVYGAYRRPCSSIVDAADYVVWRAPLKNKRPDALRARKVRLRSPLKSAKSVRVFDMSREQPRQLACGRAASPRG
jgi:hypothetical protein